MASKTKDDVLDTNFARLIIQRIGWHHLEGSVGGPGMRKFSHVREEYGNHGVYQILHKNDYSESSDIDIIDSRIAYSGSATNLFHRPNKIRTNRGSHPCRIYISNKNIDSKDLYIRFFLTEPGKETELESLIHNETESKFGSRFAWREASDGKNGKTLKILDIIDDIENLDDLKVIAKAVRNKAKDIFENNWLSEVEED